MRVTNQTIYVLRSQPYSETSLLLDVFSRQQGRLKLIAKGARKKTKTKIGEAAKLQPFIELRSGWYGKSALKNLTQTDIIRSQLTRPDKLIYGMYLNELLFYLLIENDANPEIFDLYSALLDKLNTDESVDYYLRVFEINLLQLLGYGIDLVQDSNGAKISDHKTYQFHPGSGFQPSEDLNIQGLSGSIITQLQQQGLANSNNMKLAKYLARMQIDYLLAGRELTSRAWYSKSP